MKDHGLVLLVLTVSILAFPTTASAQAVGQPEITSQGFDISETQVGLLGKFGRLRVRIEAPKRIAELHIKERSYEVDLANTPDVSHLGRFGLRSRPRQQKDVTLNFENYINEKLENEGKYEIFIQIIDKEGHSSKATLVISVIPEIAMEPEHSNPIREQSFEFARVGADPVIGAERFGIGWITTDVTKIVIRIATAIDGATKLSKLTIADYAAIKTREQLNNKLGEVEDMAAVEFATANNGAAGKVFAVISQDRPFVLNVRESDTSLSTLGTTVTLRGKFKF